MMFPKLGKRKRKAGGLPALDRKLCKLFSLYIRHRDCPDGWGTCISCGKTKAFEDMDAGHFVGRRHKATRFHEKNVNAQCRYCNRFCSGESFAYGRAIDEKYGTDTAEELYTLSRLRGSRLDRLWYEDAIKRYSEKLKGLEGL